MPSFLIALRSSVSMMIMKCENRHCIWHVVIRNCEAGESAAGFNSVRSCYRTSVNVFRTIALIIIIIVCFMSADRRSRSLVTQKIVSQVVPSQIKETNKQFEDMNVVLFTGLGLCWIAFLKFCHYKNCSRSFNLISDATTGAPLLKIHIHRAMFTNVHIYSN